MSFLNKEGLVQLWNHIQNGLSKKADKQNPTFSGSLNMDGDAWYSGDIYVGSTSGTHKDEGSEKVATEGYVESLYMKLNSNTVLGFYCIEDVTIVINGISKIYPANSNVEVSFIEGDTFEIIPTSNNSILSLSAYPGALSTYYPWLEGVKQFSNILFDMNPEEMYTKWNQGNQGAYQVQYAQYNNCVFWSDREYISELSKRTNYTLYYSAQLPLCYSAIPDNTFKAFYLAFGVNNDPNWGNPVYRESFAKATYATQVFSYYGARTIGIFGHDDTDFNIVLPKDCRGLMSAATAIENAGTFDAINVTNFGAKSGSWRDAFGWCGSLRNLYIKNLKVNLNVSWSPLEYDCIYFIISSAANTNAITISLSPYTYNLLGPSDFELAASKNITLELITTNYIEDRRLGQIANKADKTYVDELIANIPTESNVFIVNCVDDVGMDHTFAEIVAALESGKAIYATVNGISVMPLNCVSRADDSSVEFLDFNSIGSEFTEDQFGYAWTEGVTIFNDNTFRTKYCDLLTQRHPHIESPDGEKDIIANINRLIEKTEGLSTNKADKEDVLLKTEQTLTNEELAQVRSNLKFIGQNLEGNTYTIDGKSYTAAANSEIFGDYENNIAVGQWSISEGSGTRAIGRASHAEGAYGQAIADGTHVEGYQTKATGYWSHAEGEMTVVSSYASHAEGSYCTLPDGTKRYGTAAGYASHVEGGGCHATGSCCHVEGLASTASGAQSHAEGRYTIAAGGAQHVEGTANIEDADGKYIHIAGNGTFNSRSNAYTLDWDGNGWFAGNITVGENNSTVLTEADILTDEDIDAICGITAE